jgi:hypothetical protein
MSESSDWSPDEPLGTEAFEQGDEALDDETQLDPDFLESVELDPSLDPTLRVDDRELEEAGAEFDDPESLSTLDGGLDDPDGIGGPTTNEKAKAADADGWNLDPEDQEDEDAGTELA